MESGEIAISRAARQVTFPARFQVVAAMNPCPCGYSGHPHHEWQCGPAQVMRYRSKISGPLLDRFDLHVEVPVQTGEVLLGSGETGESSASVRERVLNARAAQTERGSLNAALAGNLLHQSCQLDTGSEIGRASCRERV